LSKNDIQSGSGSKKLSKNPDPRLRKSGSGTTLPEMSIGLDPAYAEFC